MTNDAEREDTRLQLGRLGWSWDCKLRQEWCRGRSAERIAADYGLALETVQMLIPRGIKAAREAPGSAPGRRPRSC